MEWKSLHYKQQIIDCSYLSLNASSKTEGMSHYTLFIAIAPHGDRACKYQTGIDRFVH
jgi:hypothetical protein